MSVPLTAISPQAVPLTALDTQSKKRDKCEECEEERERRRKPSRVVATVKSFSRRMSQWSLDNLRKGPS